LQRAVIEVRSLDCAILDIDGEAEEIIGDKKVKVVPVLKWLLS